MKHSGPSQRQLRMGEQIRHTLAQILQRGNLRDPILERSILSVSEVRMSPDLKIATCYIAPLTKKDETLIIKALAQNARFIRAQVAQDLRQLKYIPDFRFRLDESFDNFAKIDALLKSPEVARDLILDEEEDEEDKN